MAQASAPPLPPNQPISDPPPLISVVIAAHGTAAELAPSLESILCQTLQQLECLVITDGPLAQPARRRLEALAAQDPRLRVIEQPQAGLTCALIRGCAAARGRWIARLDVGDAMHPQRLEQQAAVLDRLSDCVLVTSDVEICGPAWEHLRTDSQPLATGEPIRVDTVPAEQGIAMDIPHHASVLFRREAYEAVGGYRAPFYFGQDWDLWYRLASAGSFVHLPQTLTRIRLFPDGLSSRHWREQRAIARLSLACHGARRRGEAEAPLLEQAAAIRPRHAPSDPAPRRRLPWDGRRAEGAYFIAEALRRNQDRRCHRYFRQALGLGFWKPRIWLRSIQSLALLW